MTLSWLMKTSSLKARGFTLIELLIAVAILAILGMIAVPAYIKYSTKAYYSDVVSAIAPLENLVATCIQDLGTVTGCSNNSNSIPAATSSVGLVNSLTVTNGTITATPIAAHGILATDTVVYTPTLNSTGSVTWSVSGGAVTDGLVKGGTE